MLVVVVLLIVARLVVVMLGFCGVVFGGQFEWPQNSMRLMPL